MLLLSASSLVVALLRSFLSSFVRPVVRPPFFAYPLLPPSRLPLSLCPIQVKWKLMVTSCYRRMGAFQKAMELYEEIHAKYPDNLECLRYLVAICKDLGHPYEQYQAKLVRLERTAAQSGGAGALSRAPPPQAAPASHDESHEDASPHGTATAAAPSSYRPGRSPDTEEKKSPTSPGVIAAPSVAGRINAGGSAARDEDEFADADLDDLLAD